MGLFFDATFADLVLGDDVTFDDDIDSFKIHANSEMMHGGHEAMQNSIGLETAEKEELERSHADPCSFYEHLDRRLGAVQLLRNALGGGGVGQV